MKRGRRYHHHYLKKSHKSHKSRRSNFNRINYFSRKHPLVISVLLIISSIILFRLSFTNSFLSSSEVFIWSIILSIGLFLAGFLVLVGWWKNHISMLTTKHHITLRH